MVRGSLTIVLGSVLASASGYVFWTYLSRRFGAQVVGEVSALGGAAAVVSLLHSRSVGASALARAHALPPSARRVLVGALAFLVGVPALVLGALAALVLLASGVTTLRDPVLFAAYAAGVAAQSFGATLDAVALALRSPGLVALRNGASSILRLPVLALVAALAGSLAGAAAALLASSVVSLGGAAWLAWRLVVAAPGADPGADPSPGLGVVVAMLRRGIGSQALVAFGTCVPAQVLPVLVVALAGTRDGGHFSIAWLVGSTCFMVAPMVCSSLLAEGSREVADLVAKVRRASLLVGSLLLAPVCLYLFAGDRVLGLFGEGFDEGGRPVLALLVLAAAPNAALNVSISVLRVRDRLRTAAAASLLGGCASLASAAALVPVMGATGAGAGWLAGQVTGALFGVRAATGTGGVWPPRRRAGRSET